MTYTEAAALQIGDKITPRVGGPVATVDMITTSFVRLSWYGLGRYDLLEKMSPLWATLERRT